MHDCFILYFDFTGMRINLIDTALDTIYGFFYFGCCLSVYYSVFFPFVELSRQLCASQKSDDPQWRLE